MATFKDNFSKQSEVYQRYRPSYPPALFEYLQSLTVENDLAWDCGTGNGQAAISLTPYYKKIYATDPSGQQIAHATPHDQVTYMVEAAEQPELKDGSVDLITIAQALHWFNWEVFYAEVHRVLKTGGALAAWTYGLPSFTAAIDKVVSHLHDDILNDYWLYENRLVDAQYEGVPFPFSKVETPQFTMQKDLTLADLLGLLNSWSAVQRFHDQNGSSPVDQIETELTRAWGHEEEQRTATWELVVLVGEK